MSKMTRYRVIALALSMLMIIGMVKGRWLDLQTYSTSMISYGVHNISNENPPNLELRISNSSMPYGEKRCKSLFGFLPCANTLPESVFLMFLYGYLMMLGEELSREGSEALYKWMGANKNVGSSVFRVLTAFPKIVVVIVPGILSSASDAQNQVVFGVNMYAGSTVITLTLVWGISIYYSKHKVKKESSTDSRHQQGSSKKCLSQHEVKKEASQESDQQQESAQQQHSSSKSLSQQDSSIISSMHTTHKQEKIILTVIESLKRKLSDTSVNIDKKTGKIAMIMLLSMIPFAFVGLVSFVNTPAMTLRMLIVSGVSLLLYFGYQVYYPWIGVRSLTYLNQENLRVRFLVHIQTRVEVDLLDEEGKPNATCFERIFDEADNNKDHKITHNELKLLVQKVFKLENDKTSKESDTKSENEKTSTKSDADMKSENEKTSKESDAKSENEKTSKESGAKSENDKTSKELDVKLENGKTSKELDSEYAKTEILAHFDKNDDGEISWEEFKQGCTNWLEEWEREASSSRSPYKTVWNQVLQIARIRRRSKHSIIKKIMPSVLKQVFEKYELVEEGGRQPNKKEIEGLFSNKIDDDVIHEKELKQFFGTLFGEDQFDRDRMLDELVKEFVNDKNNYKVKKNEFVDGFINLIKEVIDVTEAIEMIEKNIKGEIDTPDKWKNLKAIVYVILGVGIMVTITSAFITSVKQFSNAAHIPFFFTSFVLAPIALKAKLGIKALLKPHDQTNASLTFSEIYDGLVMDNLLGLSTLLTILYIKGLSWTYSAEVFTIMIPCAIVGTFALIKRDNYPVWASIPAILLYPVSVCIYYLLAHARTMSK